MAFGTLVPQSVVESAWAGEIRSEKQHLDDALLLDQAVEPKGRTAQPMVDGLAVGDERAPAIHAAVVRLGSALPIGVGIVVRIVDGFE